MCLKRLAEQVEAFKELPSGMQLRKRAKLNDESTTVVQQQIETTDYQEFQMEDEIGQDIQIELDEGVDYVEGGTSKDAFEDEEILSEKGNE